MTARIAVVGDLNVDLHLFDVADPTRSPIEAGAYLLQPGGKGANQARAAARLGAEVMLVGRVGDDEFGENCLAVAGDDGVDTQYVLRSEARTGIVAIALIEGRHRTLVLSPGANACLTWDDVTPALPDMAGCDALILAAEVAPPVVARLSAWAEGTGVPLYLDPAPPERVTNAALRAATAVTPDRDEAAALTGRDLSRPTTPVLAARDLMDAGARRALVKVAESGVVLADGDGIRRIPTLAVPAVDETGAGDVFVAALAVDRAAGASWDDAARHANAASALSVSRPGLSLPTATEVAAAVADISDAERLDA